MIDAVAAGSAALAPVTLPAAAGPDLAATARTAPAAETVALWQAALSPAAASAPPAAMAAAPAAAGALAPTPTDLRAAVLQAYPPPVAPPAGLGDRILDGLQGVQQRFGAQLQAVAGTLEGTPSMTDLLRMQLGMAQMSFQVELVGKAISRGTQNLDQLMRMQ